MSLWRWTNFVCATCVAPARTSFLSLARHPPPFPRWATLCRPSGTSEKAKIRSPHNHKRGKDFWRKAIMDCFAGSAWRLSEVAFTKMVDGDGEGNEQIHTCIDDHRTAGDG